MSIDLLHSFIRMNICMCIHLIKLRETPLHSLAACENLLIYVFLFWWYISRYIGIHTHVFINLLCTCRYIHKLIYLYAHPRWCCETTLLLGSWVLLTIFMLFYIWVYIQIYTHIFVCIYLYIHLYVYISICINTILLCKTCLQVCIFREYLIL